MKVPVVYIHKGFQNYLNLSLRKTLERNETILIGDNQQAASSINGLKWFDFNTNINDDYHKFNSFYVHMTSLPEHVERLCFSRWFVLKNWMVSNKVDVVMYIDSDVLLYVNAEEEFKKHFSFYDLTLIHRTSAHTSFFTIDGLSNFCEFLIKTYSSKNSYAFEKIASHYNIRRKHNLQGGVCDMTLLEFFQYENYGKVGEMMFMRDGSTYDHNINVPDFYFDFVGKRKNVEFIDGIPYVKNLKIDKKIKFNSLHCTGINGKKYIEMFTK